MGTIQINWQNARALTSRDFTCGYCGASIASQQGFYGLNNSDSAQKSYIYICHKCSQPTYFSLKGKQTPGSAYGNSVKDITAPLVESLYEEARNCISANAFTAAVLCSRKLLMNIAVSKGVPKGKTFFEYVEFLSSNNFIPPDGKGWVDQIRTKGNEANHEIAIMEKEDAEELIDFLEMLLKFIYEFPAKIKKKAVTNPA